MKYFRQATGALLLSGCFHQPPPPPQTWVEATPRLQTVLVHDSPAFDISPLLEIERSTSNLPALAGALVEGNRIVAVGATGVRRTKSSDAVTIDDKWHLGSVTKSMTATLTAILIEEGLLDWDTTVAEVFDGLVEEIDPEWESVSVLDLSRHLGGAPEPNLLALYKGRTTDLPPPAERFNWVRDVVLPEAPATRGFRYTNGNYILLGAVLELLSGRSWQRLLTEKLFVPLGLTSAGFGAPKGMNQPWGHLPTSHTGPLSILPGALADNPPVLGPAGTVHMSIADLARYAQAHLDLFLGRSVIWQGEAFELLHVAPEGHSKNYASGWVIETNPTGFNGISMHHNGTNGYWFAKIGIAPGVDRAMVCTSNFFDRGQADELCDTFIKRLVQWSPP